MHKTILVEYDLARQADFIPQAASPSRLHGYPETLPLLRRQPQPALFVLVIGVAGMVLFTGFFTVLCVVVTIIVLVVFAFSQLGD
jgi:hypothetical protein